MNRIEPLVLIIGRIVNAAIALGSLAVLTRLLPPQEYLLVALLSAFGTFAGLILINPSGQWFQRHLHEWHDAGSLQHRLRVSLVFWGWSAFGVGVAACMWVWTLLDRSASVSVMAAVSVGGFILLSTGAQMAAASLNALGHRLQGVLWSVVATGFPLLGAMVAILQVADAFVWFVGQAVGAGVAFLGAYRALMRTQSRAGETGGIAMSALPYYRTPEYWRFALPLTAVTAAMWLEGNGYRFILEGVWSPAQLGVFLLALSIPAQMTTVLESFMFQYAYPYFFRNLAGVTDRQHRGEIASALTASLLPLYWLWGAILLFMAPQFVFVIVGDAYHEAVQWIVFGCLIEVARLTGNAWSVTALADKDYRPMTLPFAIGAVASLVAVMVVVEGSLSPAMLGIGLVVAAMIKALFVVTRSRRMLPVAIAWRRPLCAGILLIVGLVGHGWALENHGPWWGVLVLCGLGLLFAVVGYVHLRICPGFNRLLHVKLG